MSLDYSPELRRQHEAHKAVLARLNRVPLPSKAPQAAIVSKFPPVFKVAVEKAVSCESLWLDWLSQQHMAEGCEAVVSEPAVGHICLEVRRQFGVEKMDFLSARRHRKFVVPRQIAMALSKCLTLRSLPEIGRRIGGRDHTTILHGCRKMQPVTDAVAAKIRHGASVAEWVAAMKAEILITPCAPAVKYRRKAV